MKALTLYQPWATLVAIEAKKIETRSWQTNHRGSLAIHASRSKEFIELAFECRFKQHLHAAGYLKDGVFDLPLGKVVAISNLTDCRQSNGLFFLPNWVLNSDEICFGDFSEGRFLWFLKDVLRLDPPVPARGKQGLWEWRNK